MGSHSNKGNTNVNKKLRYAVNQVLNIAINTTCEDLHHPTKFRHKADEVCPAEYHLYRQVHIIREYFKKLEKEK